MKKKIQIIPSGIPLVDKFWGGFYRSGTYFLIGRHKSGKTLLSIQYAMECVKQKEVCLFFTTMRPKDLMIHAASIDFDLQQSMDQNLVIVIRVSPPENYQPEKKDEYLLEYISDIATLVQQYHPNRIIFDELTPFIEFKNQGLLKTVFSQTVEIIDELNIISLFVLGEPATAQSKYIVDILTSLGTGVVYLEKEEDEFRLKSGIMTIVPNIGHIEGKYSASYYLEPYKGISIEQKSLEENIISIHHPKRPDYKNLAEIELPEPIYTGSNIYTFEELQLFINNQIAVYKSIKQKFAVISFHLQPSLESNRLTIIQLKNAVRLSIERKDKICVVDNNIVVLVVNNGSEYLNIAAKVKDNLPVEGNEGAKLLMKQIWINTITVDDTINNSNDIFRKLLPDESKSSIIFT